MIDIFNMVDMGGIDVAKAQGEKVDGLFLRLLNSIQNCRYSVLCNWLFAEIPIVPTYVELVFDGEQVSINDLITVTSDDIVHIHSIEGEPVIHPLSVAENGIFTPQTGVDGFSPVNVNVPEPVIQPLSVTENGFFVPPEGVTGYSPITVNVGGGIFPVLLMNHGQISNETQYLLPQFDAGTDITDYDFLIVKLWRENTFWGYGYVNPNYLSDGHTASTYGNIPSYTIRFNSAGVLSVQYSGDYVNSYIDVYGVTWII